MHTIVATAYETWIMIGVNGEVAYNWVWSAWAQLCLLSFLTGQWNIVLVAVTGAAAVIATAIGTAAVVAATALAATAVAVTAVAVTAVAVTAVLFWLAAAVAVVVVVVNKHALVFFTNAIHGCTTRCPETECMDWLVMKQKYTYV